MAGPPDEMMPFRTFNQSPTAQERALRRFRAYHNPSGPEQCWRWTGQTNQKGYGRLWNGDRLVGAHRFAFEVHSGPIPDGMEIGHLCHTRLCVNPSHLAPMTHAQNLRMRYAREGSPAAALGRPMTAAERMRRHRARRNIESGWWVAI